MRHTHITEVTQAVSHALKCEAVKCPLSSEGQKTEPFGRYFFRRLDGGHSRASEFIPWQRLRHITHISFLGLLFFTFFFTLFSLRAARADYTATIDPSPRLQTFEGWGTSLAWWATVVGGFPEPYRSDYITKIFDPVQGLGLTVVRYNIGGGEAPGLHFMQPRAAVPGYEAMPGQWDWSADAGQRWVLQAAMKKGVDHVEAFSNSPPSWMTQSGSVTGATDGGDNLDPKYNGAFAEYLVTVAQHFHDHWGITFRTLEPLNEPISSWWKRGGRQEGCHFSRPAQAAIIQAVGTSLAAKGLRGTTVSASDENSINEALASWNALDAPTQAMVGQVNTHSYTGTERMELRAAANKGGKRLWMSEYGDGDMSGITLSERILADMNEMHPAAWVYWQAVDGGGWGLLVNPEDGAPHFAYTINPKYYVMANYSRYIRPGDTLLATTDAHSLAAYNAKSRKLVLVTTNSTEAATTVTYDLSQFRQVSSSVQAVRTSPIENLTPLPAIVSAQQHFQALLPPRSVTTFVLSARR